MTRSTALALSAALIFSSLSFASDSAFSAEGADSSRAGSLFNSLLWRDNGHVRDYPDLEPPRDLTRSNSVHDEGIIVVTQSKKQLGQGIANNTLRVEQLQEQVRQLTGQIEQLVFETQRLQEQIRIMQEDNESRFQELEGGEQRSDLNDPAATGETAVGEEGAEIASVIENSQGGTDVGLIGDVRPSDAGAGIPEGEEPLDLGSGIRSQNEATNHTINSLDNLPESGDPLLQQDGVPSLGTLSVSPDESPDALYNLGYTQILNGDYAAAEENLRRFSKLYPNHALNPNARYWLGETYFVRGQFSNAVAEFSTNYKTFPDSDKAPDSLLKLGLSLAKLEERAAACATLSEMFSRFPDASRSLQIAAQDELARSNCI